MSKNKKFQIPLTEAENQLYRSAALIYNISAAEWARRILKKAAERDLSSSVIMNPLDAAEKIISFSEPVSDVDTMIKESTSGRLV